MLCDISNFYAELTDPTKTTASLSLFIPTGQNPQGSKVSNNTITIIAALRHGGLRDVNTLRDGDVERDVIWNYVIDGCRRGHYP